VLPGAAKSNGSIDRGSVRLSPSASGRSNGSHKFSAAERRWLDHVTSTSPTAIAVMHPEWRGVRSSTVELFPQHYFLEDCLDEEQGDHVARLLLESGCKRIVISAFPHSYIHLVMALHRRAPQVKIFNYWLGSFLQSNEDYTWQGFRAIEELCRDRIIYKWGFAKKGMAEIMASLGLHTGFLMSMVRHVPGGASIPLDGGPHLGLWAIESIWRKSPYGMLAAAHMIAGARVHGSGKDRRALEFARLFKLNTNMYSAPIPHEQMPQKLAQMHLNLYVTLSECAPMLPLESLAVGAPCLIGPTSHYFEDHAYLHSRLVVPYPDRALVIAEYIERALAERDQIIAAYKEYVPGYNDRALQSVREFLELDVDTQSVHKEN
jgi:hypothetical protein